VITVIEVMREMGIEPTNELSWRVGAAARDAYVWQFGHEPPKDIRPKTHDRGSHCFALYPTEMKPRLKLIIRGYMTEAARQGDLFGG
jgi:hypothetical protein